jgi:hypothetical protein
MHQGQIVADGPSEQILPKLLAQQSPNGDGKGQPSAA